MRAKTESPGLVGIPQLPTPLRRDVQLYVQVYDVLYDLICNGQLKPGYNVQIAVNSEYITGLEAFSDRGDAKTFRPMMRKLAEKHGKPYEECVADAGYESQENYLYLAQNGQVCFIKPTNYDQKKTKKFKR